MECTLKYLSSDNVKQVLTTLDEYLRLIPLLLVRNINYFSLCRSLNSTEKVLENHCSAGIDLLLPVCLLMAYNYECMYSCHLNR